jgi:hypothetical protein
MSNFNAATLIEYIENLFASKPAPTNRKEKRKWRDDINTAIAVLNAICKKRLYSKQY